MNLLKSINFFDGFGHTVILAMHALLVAFLASFVAANLMACSDFHGPWEFYPEEREIYTGIYTYGYIVDGESPHVCFSKVYGLDETSAEDFAFYDSAHVTMEGVFASPYVNVGNVDTAITLRPYASGPNCFTDGRGVVGVEGESYTMDAYFEWDSAGHRVKSRFRATATIPKAVKVKGLNVPRQDGSYEWMENKDSSGTGKGANVAYSVDFLEFPMDLEFIKCALDFDKSIGGVLSILNYGIGNEESVKTTINQMLKGLTDADSNGYRGISMHDPLETRQSFGFSENRRIAGFNNLDTLYLMNMMLPIGEISVDLYATDRAYVDYVNKVKESVSDSRIVPKSNIENGMGVFSGMAKTTIRLKVNGSGVELDDVAWHNCQNTEGDHADSWDSRGCRLYQDVTCAGLSPGSDLVSLNESAYLNYRNGGWGISKACYASNVKAAMMLDTTRWSIFLPDSISEKDKSNAYADGLKRYCVASNFENNKIADCYDMYRQCMVNPEKNTCKEYLWLWCADRGWDMDYEQCRGALVTRYYLTEQKSNVLHREVEEICSSYKYIDDEKTFYYPVCANWCKIDVEKWRAECK